MNQSNLLRTSARKHVWQADARITYVENLPDLIIRLIHPVFTFTTRASMETLLAIIMVKLTST
jgi:hypothetical protein